MHSLTFPLERFFFPLFLDPPTTQGKKLLLVWHTWRREVSLGETCEMRSKRGNKSTRKRRGEWERYYWGFLFVSPTPFFLLVLSSSLSLALSSPFFSCERSNMRSCVSLCVCVTASLRKPFGRESEYHFYFLLSLFSLPFAWWTGE